jgi:hypothetical protein
MSWEMLSGPDLGGGFLFQLTLETLGPRARLIYHAQEGGIDASGPPKGSPLPFGFARTTTACEIGGRDCYHRTFELAAEEVPTARMAYNRLRFVTAPMLEQQYGHAEVPLRAGADELATRLTTAFADQPEGWFFAGSSAAWLQGVAVTPREIDLGTDTPGLTRIARALSEYLVEPLADTTWRDLGPVRGARAYVGTLRSGVRVQWARRPEGARPVASDLGADPHDVVTTVVALGDRPVRVSRLEYALVRAAASGDRSDETAIAARLREVGPDLELLGRLLAMSGVPASSQSRARTSVAAAADGARG